MRDLLSTTTERPSRYEHSVITAASALHSYAVGSFDAPMDEMRELAEWLEWRITEGWSHGPNNSVFDDIVRQLASQALTELRCRTWWLESPTQPIQENT